MKNAFDEALEEKIKLLEVDFPRCSRHYLMVQLRSNGGVSAGLEAHAYEEDHGNIKGEGS